MLQKKYRKHYLPNILLSPLVRGVCSLFIVLGEDIDPNTQTQYSLVSLMHINKSHSFSAIRV